MTVHHDASFCARDRCQGLAAEVEQLRQQVRVLTGLHRSAEEEVEQLREENAEHLLRADSLRAELRRTQDENERLYDELHLGQDEAKRLRAVVQAVRGLHHRVEPPEDSMWLPYCEHSGRIHPCPTIRTLDAALGGERE